MTISELNPARTAGDPPGERTSTMVAIEAVLLWPHRPTGKPTGDGETGLWPVLAVVLGDQAVPNDPSARQLFDLLYHGQRTGRVTMLHGASQWSIRDGQDLMLRLAVRASTPIKLDVDVVLPAQPLRHILATLARGATVAITTRRHADRLTAGVSARDALHGLVLVTCPPSMELAALARAHSAAGARQLVH